MDQSWILFLNEVIHSLQDVAQVCFASFWSAGLPNAEICRNSDPNSIAISILIVYKQHSVNTHTRFI